MTGKIHMNRALMVLAVLITSQSVQAGPQGASNSSSSPPAEARPLILRSDLPPSEAEQQFHRLMESGRFSEAVTFAARNVETHLSEAMQHRDALRSLSSNQSATQEEAEIRRARSQAAGKVMRWTFHKGRAEEALRTHEASRSR
jgi:hypothetical protein